MIKQIATVQEYTDVQQVENAKQATERVVTTSGFSPLFLFSHFCYGTSRVFYVRRTTKMDLLAKCSPTWADVSYEALLVPIQIPPYWRLQPKQTLRETFKITNNRNKGPRRYFVEFCVSSLCKAHLYQTLHNRLHFPLLHAVYNLFMYFLLCSFTMTVCPVWWGCECVTETRRTYEGGFKEPVCVCVVVKGTSEREAHFCSTTHGSAILVSALNVELCYSTVNILYKSKVRLFKCNIHFVIHSAI